MFDWIESQRKTLKTLTSRKHVYLLFINKLKLGEGNDVMSDMKIKMLIWEENFREINLSDDLNNTEEN